MQSSPFAVNEIWPLIKNITSRSFQPSWLHLGLGSIENPAKTPKSRHSSSFEGVRDWTYPFFDNITNVLKKWIHLNVSIYGAHGARGYIHVHMHIHYIYIYVMYNILYIHHIPYLVGHIPPHFWGFKCIAYARAWRFSTIARLLPSRHRGSELGCKNSLLVQLN